MRTEFLLCLFCFTASQHREIPSVIKIAVVLPDGLVPNIVASLQEAAANVNKQHVILPNTKLELVFADSGGTAWGAVSSCCTVLEKGGFYGIIGGYSHEETKALTSPMKVVGLPQVSFTASLNVYKDRDIYPNFLRLLPADEDFGDPLLDLVQYLNYTQVTLVTSDDEHVANTMNPLSNNEGMTIIAHHSFNMLRLEEINAVLDSVLNGLGRVVVFDLATTRSDVDALTVLSTFLVAANEREMFGLSWMWIFGDGASSLLELAAVEPAAREVLDGCVGVRLNTGDSSETFKGNDRFGKVAADAVDLYAHALHTQFIKNPEGLTIPDVDCFRDKSWDEGRIVWQAMEKTRFDGESGPVGFDEDGDRDMDFEILNFRASDGLVVVGQWSSEVGSTFFTHMDFPSGSTVPPSATISESIAARINVAALLWPPYVEYNQTHYETYKLIDVDEANNAFSGLTVEMLRWLGEDVGFSFRLVPVEADNYTDTVLRVSRREFDAAIGDITITADRSKIVDFSLPWLDNGLVVVVQTHQVSFDFWQFFGPFSGDLWALVLGVCVMLGIFFYIVERSTNDDIPEGVGRGLYESIWWALASLVGAGDKDATCLAGRLIQFAHGLFITIVLATYTANLAAFLSKTQIGNSIQGFSDVGGKTICAEAGGAGVDFLNKALGNTESVVVAGASLVKCLDDLHDGRVDAVLADRSTINYEIWKRNNCHVRPVGQIVNEFGYGIVMTKGFDVLTEHVSEFLLYYREQLSGNRNLAGLVRDNNLALNTTCVQSTNSGKFGVDNLVGLFLLTGIVCSVALAASLVQSLLTRSRKLANENTLQASRTAQAEANDGIFYAPSDDPSMLKRSETNQQKANRELRQLTARISVLHQMSDLQMRRLQILTHSFDDCDQAVKVQQC